MDENGRFAVNGLLGLNTTFALYMVGPVLGGVIVASTNAGVALFVDACGALTLLLAVLAFVPRAADDRDTLRRPPAPESGWRILRRRPVAARLLAVEGGPLIELAGSTGGLALSGGLTMLLLPIAALAVLRPAMARFHR